MADIERGIKVGILTGFILLVLSNIVIIVDLGFYHGTDSFIFPEMNLISLLLINLSLLLLIMPLAGVSGVIISVLWEKLKYNSLIIGLLAILPFSVIFTFIENFE